LIRKGNRSYKKEQYDQSLADYQKAIKKSPGNADAHFNLGDAQFRKNDYEKAAASYDEVLQSKANEETRQSAYYNKGVALIRQKKLQESIDAWKNALRLNASDSDARENLVKALLEKKQQDQKQQEQNKKDQKDKKPEKDKQKQDQNKEENQPKQPQSKLTKQQVEQYLKSLLQREKDVQDKMNQSKSQSQSQPDKDW